MHVLTANIDAKGVLQNLVVCAGDKRGRYYVTAGECRRKALLLLVEKGKIAESHPVECKVRDGAKATESSLSENIFREDMHPVDQFDAFSVMVGEGKPKVCDKPRPSPSCGSAVTNHHRGDHDTEPSRDRPAALAATIHSAGLNWRRLMSDRRICSGLPIEFLIYFCASNTDISRTLQATVYR